jgi:aromatic ring-opening dioxygenase catalytic subunit (LigB family)
MVEMNEAREGQRMPVAYIPHGGGPWPFVEMGLDKRDVTDLVGYLESVRQLPKTPPKALLVVSAHWEEPLATVMTAARPPILYDYHGFPPASYQITWPAPGDPALAARVRDLLGPSGFETASDAERGFDHGTFIPLKVTYPEANIPTIQLSLLASLDPAQHLAMGRALAPLRDERGRTISEEFDAWLRDAATQTRDVRDARLTRWADAPRARDAHPREEHLLPLMVVAGAAGDDRGTVAYDKSFMGVRVSAYHFG